MDCISYVYDKNYDISFWVEVDFIDFKDMDYYIGFCEEYGFIIERIIDKHSNIIYFDALPEGSIICMMQ